MQASQVINFAVPPSKIKRIKVASAIAGSLGKPSKMPGLSYGISALACRVGAKLAKVAGSVCNGCYALKANYSYPSVQKAHVKRYNSLTSISWVDSMVTLIGRSNTDYFRWHDSGDLQSFQHLLDIVTIAERLPTVSFWLPTREKQYVNMFMRSFGSFPSNLVVRVSAAMVDAKAPEGYENTSTVHTGDLVDGIECMAWLNDNKCGACRLCWDKTVKTVSYRKH
jgi:hypothetical protein